MNKLYVLMGYPGCGKTYFMKQKALLSDTLVLSSDALRVELFGFRDQTRNNELFTELYRRAEEHSKIGDTYIDATNLSRKDRLKITNHFKKFYDLYLLCFLRPVNELVEVNEQRKNTEEYIPDDIFKRILGKFQLPTYEEGWDHISFKINSINNDLNDIIFDYDNMTDLPHDNPHHPESIKEHIDYLVEYCDSNNIFPVLKTLASYHDLGKFFVKAYNEEKGYSQTIGHAAVSAYIYLMDSVIKYLLDYDKQQGILNSTIDRTFDIYKMSIINDILLMYYLIYYHDQPYSCENKESLLHSLNKSSKPLKYFEDKEMLYIEYMTDLLIGFNKIDRMREGDDDDGRTTS